MRRPGLSIAGLMLLIIPIALALAAVRFASEFCEEALMTITLLVLGFSILAAIERRQGRRTFWRGFAIFGWGYLALVFGPISDTIKAKLLPELLSSWVQVELDKLEKRSFQTVLPAPTPEELAKRPPPPKDPNEWISVLESGFTLDQPALAREAYEYRDMLSLRNYIILADRLNLVDANKSPIHLTLLFDRDRVPMVSRLLWTWLAALLGGWLGRRLYDSSKTVA